MSPSARSTKLLRAEGWHADTVERYNSFTRRRNDLYQFGDILAFRGDEMLIVQTTSGSNVSARIAKIRLIPVADDWLAGTNRRIEVHGWRKLGKRGQRKTWQCRRVTLERQSPALEFEPLGVEEDGDEIFTPVKK